MLSCFFSIFINRLYFLSNYSVPSPAFDAVSGVTSGICFMYYETIICFTVVLARTLSQLVVNWGLYFSPVLLCYESFYCSVVHVLEMYGYGKGCMHKIKSHEFSHILVKWVPAEKLQWIPWYVSCPFLGRTRMCALGDLSMNRQLVV